MKNCSRSVFTFVCSLAILLVTSYAVGQSAAVSNLDNIAGRASSGGAVPRVVKYAGALSPGTDASGNAVATTVPVTFALYVDENATAPVWMETQTVSVDATGKYTVLLGAMSQGGLSSDLFQAGESRWLGIKSGDGAETRVLLVSVPYAMKSEDAETLGGHKVTDFLLTPEAAAAAGLTRPKADAQVSTLITDTGTAVGIGTTTPAYTLDIKNADATAAGAAIFRLQTPSVNGAVMHFLSTSTNGHDWAFGSNFINGVGEFGIFDYTANVSRFFITATGQVGINSGSPQFTMD